MPVYRKPSADVDELSLPTQPDCIVKMRHRGETGLRYDAEDYILRHRQDFKPEANGSGVIRKEEILGDTWTVAMWELLTLALIEDWNLEDEAGEKWPFTVASLRRLDPVDGTFLETEARKRMDGLDGPFGSTLPKPSEASRSKIPGSIAPSSLNSSPTATDGHPRSFEASALPT